MPVDRPTFSESWYRVVDLRPRLRTAVQIHRQHYRDQTWYVVQDPANNQYYRLSPAAYHMVGMLDGRRTVGQVWKACNEELGDDCPTQGEAIQLLGQLYTANLIQSELPPDAESMFRRFKQRKTREIQGYLTNILFIRLPLYDPDALLNRWISVVGWLFSPVGAILWLAMIGLGVYHLIGRSSQLWAEGQAQQVLTAANLPWLYLVTAVVKALHEFGHAFACKRFGVRNGSGGEVHVMGVMFLVFTPLPYVDATSMYAFASKWQRAIVGLGGMLVELFLAAIAAVIWSQTRDGTLAHTLAYNVIFIAGVSTVLFNANPLLRYDGYYILSDLLEIPNLWQRSREYLHYLVKKYVWGVRRPRNPSQMPGEKAWLLVFSVASTIYRAFVVVAILMFIARALPVLGLALAIVSVAAWVLVPLGKFLHYLLANPELLRVRARAVGTTLLTLGAVGFFIGRVHVPAYLRADAVVRPQQRTLVFAQGDGFLQDYQKNGAKVQAGSVLLSSRNRQLELSRQAKAFQRKRLEAEEREAREKQENYKVVSIQEQLAALDKLLAWMDQELGRLQIKAPHSGTWIAPQLDKINGSFIKRKDPVGMLVNTDCPLIEAVVTQEDVDRLFCETCDNKVELRLPGLPGQTFRGRIISRVPGGQRRLPSPALAAGGGGKIPLDPKSKTGETAQPFFRVLIQPEQPCPPLRAEQLVAVRFELPDKTLAVRWYRSILQLVQKNFQT